LKHKINEQEYIQWKGGTYVGIGVGVDFGDAVFVIHVFIEAADVGEEVIGVRGEEEASSRVDSFSKTLPPFSRTRS
jgi:hypothetical protein